MEIDIEQRSESWFALRRCYITGTMFAIIMGKNPYTSLGDMLEQMQQDAMGLPPKEMSPKSQKNVDWGTSHETDGVSEYEKKILGNFPSVSEHETFPSFSNDTSEQEIVHPKPLTDPDLCLDATRSVRKVGFVIDTETYKFGVSPDGFVGDDGIIEVKCPVSRRFYASIPEYYVYQVMALLGVTKRKWCDLVQWTPNGIKCTRFTLDATLWSEMKEAGLQFYELHKHHFMTMKKSLFAASVLQDKKHKREDEDQEEDIEP